MAAHRYYRLVFGTTPDGGATAIQTITMGGADGVNLATAAANVIADPKSRSSYPAVAAIAGGAGEWVADSAPGSTWAYDFGAGNTVDIQTIGLTVPGYVGGFPTSVQVQSSDTNNGTDWTSTWSETIPASPVTGQVFNYHDPALDTVFPAGEYRYWQLLFPSSSVTPTIAVQYVTLAGTDNINRATSPAMVSGDNKTRSGYPAINAIVGQAGEWVSDGAPNAYLAFDFGPGNAFNIQNVELTVPDYVAGFPTSLNAQASSSGNGTDWTTIWSAAQSAAVTSGQVITYSSSGSATPTPPVTPTPPATPTDQGRTTAVHRYWQVYVRQTASAGAMGAHAIALYTADGVNQATLAANASSSTLDGGTPPGNAIIGAPQDPNSDSDNWAFGGSVPGWWGYDLGAGNAALITTVGMRARNDAYFDQLPTEWDLRWSDDGTDYNTQWSATLAAPVQEQQLYTVHDPEVVVPAALAVQAATTVLAFDGFESYSGVADMFAPTRGFLTWSGAPDTQSGFTPGGPLQGVCLSLADDPITATLAETVACGVLGFRVGATAAAAGPMTVRLLDAYGVTFFTASFTIGAGVTTITNSDSSQPLPGPAAGHTAAGLYFEVGWSWTPTWDTVFAGVFGVSGASWSEFQGCLGTSQSLASVVFTGATQDGQSFEIDDIYLIANVAPVNYTGGNIDTGYDTTLGDVQVVPHPLTPDSLSPLVRISSPTPYPELAMGTPPVSADHLYLASRIQATYNQTGTGAAVVQSLLDAPGQQAQQASGAQQVLPAAGTAVTVVDVLRAADAAPLTAQSGGTLAGGNPGGVTDATIAAGAVRGEVALYAIGPDVQGLTQSVNVTNPAVSSLVRSTPVTVTPTPTPTPSTARGYAFIMA